MEIKLNRTIKREILESVFVTALEGGSNYWYFLGDDAIKIIKSSVPLSHRVSLSEALFMAVFDHGCTIPIRDLDNEDEIIGELSAATIQERLQWLSDNEACSWAIDSELSEEGDACSSDIVFQALCLGDVVYS